MSIPKQQLGRTGVKASMLDLGGEGILRSHGYDREAYDLINRALDLGITYCESARAYDGSESYYGKALRERRSEIFLTSKSHVGFASSFQPMTTAEQDDLVRHVAPYARQLMHYKP